MDINIEKAYQHKFPIEIFSLEEQWCLNEVQYLWKVNLKALWQSIPETKLHTYIFINPFGISTVQLGC